MRTLTLVTISALSLLSLSSLGCGGSTPPQPATPPAESTEADASAPRAAADMPATPESAAATSDAGATESASTPAASASASAAAPAPSGPDLTTQGQAECAGIAAPFEERVRAKFNECYQAGKKKNPELAGTIKVTLKVDTKGKVTKYVPDPSKLDKPVFDCMVKVVKKEPFDGKACAGKDVTVSKTYGR